jgi:hypothetical protein
LNFKSFQVGLSEDGQNWRISLNVRHVFTTVKIKVVFFWFVTRYSLAFTGVSEEFTAGSFDMSVSTHNTAQYNDPDAHKMLKYICFICKIVRFVEQFRQSAGQKSGSVYEFLIESDRTARLNTYRPSHAG